MTGHESELLETETSATDLGQLRSAPDEPEGNSTLREVQRSVTTVGFDFFLRQIVWIHTDHIRFCFLKKSQA